MGTRNPTCIVQSTYFEANVIGNQWFDIIGAQYIGLVIRTMLTTYTVHLTLNWLFLLFICTLYKYNTDHVVIYFVISILYPTPVMINETPMFMLLGVFTTYLCPLSTNNWSILSLLFTNPKMYLHPRWLGRILGVIILVPKWPKIECDRKGNLIETTITR